MTEPQMKQAIAVVLLAGIATLTALAIAQGRFPSAWERFQTGAGLHGSSQGLEGEVKPGVE